MPELPEVETTVRGLARYLDGARIARVQQRRADLRRPFPDGLVQVLTGATVSGLGRRAKYGLVHLDRGQTMVFHLGMSGRWRIEPEDLGAHDHLVLETDAPDIPPSWLYVPQEVRRAGQVVPPNRPAEIPRMGAVLADLRGMPVEELCAATTAKCPIWQAALAP